MKENKNDHAPVRIFPPLALVLSLLSIRVLNRYFPWAFPPFDTIYYLALLVMGAGAGVVVWAVVELRRGKTAVNPFRATRAIVATGPYDYSRNPIYVGFLLLVLGYGLYHFTWWAVVAMVVLLITLHFLVVLPEEEYLTEKFGEQYLYYYRRVRRWL